MDWVTARYPERFTLDRAAGTISTHTQGYERCFAIAEFAAEPLRLAGMVSAACGLPSTRRPRFV